MCRHVHVVTNNNLSPQQSGDVNKGLAPSSPSPDDPPDEAHLMVAQEHWEDRVNWDVPFSTGPALAAVGGAWKPVAESAMSFSRQLSTGRSFLGGGMGGGAGVAGDPAPTNPMFPVDNYELTYGRWEDNIIWDCDAVDHIPSPTLPRVDPNDSNFIIGIPEEPPPTFTGDKDGRKVHIFYLCCIEVCACGEMNLLHTLINVVI